MHRCAIACRVSNPPYQLVYHSTMSCPLLGPPMTLDRRICRAASPISRHAAFYNDTAHLVRLIDFGSTPNFCIKNLVSGSVSIVGHHSSHVASPREHRFVVHCTSAWHDMLCSQLVHGSGRPLHVRIHSTNPPTQGGHQACELFSSPPVVLHCAYSKKIDIGTLGRK